MRATEEKKIREQLTLKRREANEAYRRSQAVNREATAEPRQDLADQASEGPRKSHSEAPGSLQSIVSGRFGSEGKPSGFAEIRGSAEATMLR